MTNVRFALLPVLLLVGLFATLSSCSDNASRSPSQGSSILADDDDNTSAMILRSISRTLNNLPKEVVTVLTPPQPVLDDSLSADGREVKAVLDVTPGVPGSPFNYLSVPEGNANFRTLKVQPGDIVRYFVKYDQDDLEHGFENVSYYELPVRRLDASNMQNALIVEGGLSAQVDVPHRIEVWRFSDRRMREIRTRLNRYLEKPNVMLGWEPSPDESALLQLVDRLNQWWRNLKTPLESWEVDSLIEKIPADIRAQEPVATLLRADSLENSDFQPWEMRLLQQAIWLRDISTWVKAEALDDLEVAAALFDWTVCNIQLDEAGADAIIHHPWQALMYGHGSAADRAWVFAELCRHQQLDVVMLAVQKAEGEPQWWLPALLIDGKLYLFDTRLGLPLPGTEAGSIATLAEVVEDPTLLDPLSIEGEEPYLLSSQDFGEADLRITAQMVASHLQLSRRAAELEPLLETEDFVTLSVDLDRLNTELEKAAHVDDVALWAYPFQSLVEEQNMPRAARLLAVQRFLVLAQRPKLWKARVLHFQGTKDIPLSERNDPLAQASFGHREATDLYQGVRITERVMKTLPPDKQVIYRIAKLDAGYWLALLKSAQGNDSVAKHWLETQTLGSVADGPWTPGARYNLARTYESLEELEKAIELLQSDQSPQRLGNVLRARQLGASLAESTDESGGAAEQ